MNILFILTSHDQLGDTDKKTGFWLEELAAPYYVFMDAGATITLASPLGGQPPLDPKSDLPESQTEMTKRFRSDPMAQAELATTKKLADVSAADFDAVFYPGGHGPMWDMPHTRVEVHLAGQYGNKTGGHGKRCLMEARLEGHQPIAVTDEADSLREAIAGAAGKLKHSLDRTLSRLNDR